jgi:hypothetical protein
MALLKVPRLRTQKAQMISRWLNTWSNSQVAFMAVVNITMAILAVYLSLKCRRAIDESRYWRKLYIEQLEMNKQHNPSNENLRHNSPVPVLACNADPWRGAANQ